MSITRPIPEINVSHVKESRRGGDREDQVAPQRTSRRALVGTAIESITRFKQSWISVMLLKASIGLGQVVTLVVLLVLSALIPSPITPHELQALPSEACPHPEFFQVWMALNLSRLAMCWMVSCWVCVRRQRRQSVQDATRDRHTNEEAQPSAIILSSQTDAIHRSQSLPSLTHSAASTSTSTLLALSASSSSGRLTPSTVYTSKMVSTLSLGAGEVLAPVRKSDALAFSVRSNSSASYKGNSGRPLSNNDQADRNTETLEAARDLHARMTTEHVINSDTQHGFAKWLDDWASIISKVLGVISALLFVLGNVLLLYPLPIARITCYHAAPLLWWGVLVVVAVGWVLFGQVFFVIVIVGVGGQAVLSTLRRFGLTPSPTEEILPLPRPDVLTISALNRLKLVTYLPDGLLTARKEGEKSASGLDVSRLAHPPIYLPAHRATCPICQECFEPPCEIKTIMLKAAPLRLLGCGHTYHAECIDQWLLQGAGSCPFCKQSVMAVIEKDEAGGQYSFVAIERKGVGEHPTL